MIKVLGGHVMIQTRKTGLMFLLSLFLTILISGMTVRHADASEVPLPTDYKFLFNGVEKPAGSEIEIKTKNTVLAVTAGNVWSPETQVVWKSSAPTIISTTPSALGDNFIQLNRLRPGFSTITAVIKHGTSSYTISCLVKVNLEINYQETGTVPAKTTNEQILKMSIGDAPKEIVLKYVDDDVASVSGSVIDAELVSWESDNTGVVTVKDGYVTAVGSGSATVTATTNTLSTKDKPMTATITVVVAPDFSLTYDDANGNTITRESGPDYLNGAYIYSGIPSNFVIDSNATLAKNLTWKVYDCTGGKKTELDPGISSKMTYSLREESGNLLFNNVKAGTYEIYAFTKSTYGVATNAPYAFMRIIVPINLGNQNIVMNVGDTYNILKNSNIPGLGVFVNTPEYIGPDDTINTDDDDDVARFNSSDYVITARRKGKVTIRLMYNSNTKLYDSLADPYFEINITVIDGIALNTTSANIYTGSTLQLDAIVSDPSEPIEWTSSNPSIASVTKEGGLVSGLKPGSVTITATQIINGVEKKATCKINVQQSVTSITLTPNKVTLPIGGQTTLVATITPSNLSGVNLQWKSSDPKVVEIVDPYAKSVIIRGVGGGQAVISAINQDNVVVGYCHVTVQQPVTSIVLSETAATVDLTVKRLQLRATVYPENAVNKAVKWSSTDTSKATVDQNGLVTVLKPGTVTIVATSVDNPNATAYCNLTIEIPVVSVALDETVKTMYVGQSARLTYVVLPTNASNSTVTWTSTNTSVATVDATGKVSAKSVGTAVIILKTLDGSKTVYCTITVKSVASGIKFDVTELKLKAGEYYDIRTTLTPADSTENELVWESSDTKVATVDDTGRVTAKSAGTAIIMARTEAGGVAYCKVSVEQPVKGLILNFSEKTIFKGEEFDLKVSVSPSSASNLGVTWTSSNPKIATVSEDGEVKGLIGGVTVITCTTADGGYSATCVVTVRETVTTIKLNYDSYRLGIGNSVKLTATVTTETATNQKVTWRSSNTKIATVNQNGKVTGLAMGYVTITATAQDGSDVEATCEIRIVQPVTSVTLNKSSMSMFIGESKSLKATIRPSNATYKKAKWISSDPSVAIVDEDGTVIGIKAGSVTITAEALDNSGKKAICYVWVNERVPSTGITIQDKKLTMVPGEEKIVQLVLIPATSTDSYTWSTDNAAVAKVDKNTGRITAKATGVAYITVMTDSGKTATVEVTVIGLNITELTVEQYTSYPYQLVVEGATAPVRWSIDNPAIAVVTNGYISTRATGTATITALVNGRKLTCKLKVVKIK
jgi:uncharacterized protein YjdB